MKTVLILALLVCGIALAPAPAAADHWQCAYDPVTYEPCLYVAAVLNCASHRLEGQPCALP